jgi:hypothetical protein
VGAGQGTIRGSALPRVTISPYFSMLGICEVEIDAWMWSMHRDFAFAESL